MPVNFFEKEIHKAQQRFNQTFGERATCNIKSRQSVILKICSLGCLKNKIEKTADKAKVKDEIRNFIKIRDILNNVFNTIEDYQKERRYFENDQRTSKQRGIYLR